MVELKFDDLAQANIDQLAPSLGFAGDTLNTAIYLKRLLAKNADVSFVSVLGLDPLSDSMIRFIESEGVNTSFIERTESKLPGLYAISTDDHGERSFSYWRNDSAARQLFQTTGKNDFSQLENFDIVYLSAITLAILPASTREALISWLSQARTDGLCLVAFDSNYRPALWDKQSDATAAIDALWRIADIAFPSIDDEQAVFNDANAESLQKRLESYNFQFGALKRGELGAIDFSDTEPTNQISFVTEKAQYDPSLPMHATIVDTTAAGDSFNAGYLAAMVLGEDARALEGHRCAASVIQHAGAIVPREPWQEFYRQVSEINR